MLYVLKQSIVIGGLAYHEGAIVDTDLLNEGAHKDLNACLAGKIAVPYDGKRDPEAARTTRIEQPPEKVKGEKGAGK